MRGRDLRIVFMGTPEFAAASLRALVEGGYNVVGVVTMPDKPSGRGLKVNKSDVKLYAEQAGLPILQPEKLRDEAFQAALRQWRPDLGIVIAFRMLPESVWSLPRLGTFNLHASLLPPYRGAAPINRAIMNGEKETGVTTFMLDRDIDTGEIIDSRRTEILPEDNAGTLHDRLMKMGTELVLSSVETIAAGGLATRAQSAMAQGELKPAPKIFKEDCRIDWNAPAEKIVNLVRGLSPRPAAWCEMSREGETTVVKIFDAAAETCDCAPAAGTVLSDGRTYLKVACAGGCVAVREIQSAGKRRMDVRQWLCGVKDIGECKFF